MAGNTFAEITLGEIANFRNGKALSPEYYTPSGKHQVFGSNGEIARTDELLNPQPVIVIGRVGAYCGCVHYVPKTSWVTDNAIVAEPKDGTHLRYLFYLLGSLELQRTAIGSAQPLMTQGGLKGVRTKAPPLAEQKAIASILGALDDKIELNRRMNATLETTARALFQSWFVDFDPVRAKLDASRPAGLDEDTAALFPSSFRSADVGRVPAGWRMGSVSDLCTFSRGAVNPAAFPDEIFHHFSLPAFDEGRMPKSELGCEIMSNKLVVVPDAVLLSKLNPHIPRIWLPHIDPQHRSVCSTEFIVATAKQCASREYLYSLFTSTAFADVYGTLVTGTTGSHQRVRAESVLEMRVIVPSQPLLDAFAVIARPIFSQVNHNQEESRTLATLRDTLLPKLLGGELRIRDSALLVEEVA